MLTKDEFRTKFHQLMQEKMCETGKSQLEILREMEFMLSQRDEDSLSTFEIAMKHALQKVDQKYFGDEAENMKRFKRSIHRRKIKTQGKFMIEYCKCWNNLNTKYIESALHENMQYTSDHGTFKINGKREYLEYLNLKFNTLRDLLEFDLFADVGFIKGKDSYSLEEPCVIVNQRLRGEKNIIVLTFTAVKNKIVDITMHDFYSREVEQLEIYFK